MDAAPGLCAAQGDASDGSLRPDPPANVGAVGGTLAELAASWTEGPGLVRTAEGHLPAGACCDDVVLDVLRPVRNQRRSRHVDLAHVGGTIASGVNCPCKR